MEADFKVVSEVKKKLTGLEYWHNVKKHAEKAAKDGQDAEIIIDIISDTMKILKKSIKQHR